MNLICFSKKIFQRIWHHIMTSELYIYLGSSGHRVKPNMAANGGPNLRGLSCLRDSKNCAGGLKST